MSAVEEDIELRELLVQFLEKNGSLAKMKAQMRANVFLAFDEEMKKNTEVEKQSAQIQSYLKTVEGQTLFFLVKEFLEFFNLHCTLEVFNSEASLETLQNYDKTVLEEQLHLSNDSNETEVPLLHNLLISKIAQGKKNILDINLNLSSNSNGDYLHPVPTVEIKDTLQNNDSHSTASHIGTEQNTTTHNSMASDILEETPNLPQDGSLSGSESSKVTDKFQSLNKTFVLSPSMNQLKESEKRHSEKLVEYADDFVSEHSSISSKDSDTNNVAERSYTTVGSASQSDKPSY